jgi:Family of unknown function (DUF5335)
MRSYNWQVTCNTRRVMSNQKTSAQQREMQEIDSRQWIAFLDQFTRENRGAHARLDVLGPGVGYQVETGGRPFQGVAADVKKGDATAVWITLGTTPPDHLTHGIHNATVIRALAPAGDTGAILEVEAQDGTKTILELTRPEDYALPPGSEEAHPS